MMVKRKTKKRTIKEHEDRYIHIPKFNLIPLLGTMIFGVLTWLNLYLIDWEVIKYVFTCEKECIIHYSALINIYPIIGEYILVALMMVSIVALFKGGYTKLKAYKDEILIAGLICGLIIGLIFGLIIGLTAGLTALMIEGLIIELIIGLIAGLIIGLIGGLILGLIYGLFNE
jgi:hypothetical protein